MKRTALFAALALLTPLAFAEGDGQPKTDQEVTTSAAGLVSVASKGQDVRSVLFDLYSQAGKSFVLEPNVRYVLYLNLKDIEFEEALSIILKSANLRSEKQNGITFISARREGDPAPRQVSSGPGTTPPAQPKPVGKLSAADLQKKVTTRMPMAELKTVFAELSKQTGFKVDLGAGLPDVKIDAFLIDTSLKFALDSICDAVGLKYTLTDSKSILIQKKAA